MWSAFVPKAECVILKLLYYSRPGKQCNKKLQASLNKIKMQLIIICDFHILQADTITTRTHAMKESGL